MNLNLLVVYQLLTSISQQDKNWVSVLTSPRLQDVFSYSSLINAFDRSNLWPEALQLLESLMDSRRQHLGYPLLN